MDNHEAQRLLEGHGVLIDPGDTLSPVEIVAKLQAMGTLQVAMEAADVQLAIETEV